MRKCYLFGLVFGVMLSVSGYAQDNKGDFFFSTGFYHGFFGNNSLYLVNNTWLTELDILKFSGNWELPLGPGNISVGLEAGYSSGFSFGGKSSIDIYPISLTTAYSYPLGGLLWIGPSLKLGAFGLVNPDWLKFKSLMGARLEAEFRYLSFPVSMYASGGIDMFPVTNKLGVLPMLEGGLRFRRGSWSLSNTQAQSSAGGTAGATAGQDGQSSAGDSSSAGTLAGAGAGTADAAAGSGTQAQSSSGAGAAAGTPQTPPPAGAAGTAAGTGTQTQPSSGAAGTAGVTGQTQPPAGATGAQTQPSSGTGVATGTPQTPPPAGAAGVAGTGTQAQPSSGAGAAGAAAGTGTQAQSSSGAAGAAGVTGQTQPPAGATGAVAGSGTQTPSSGTGAATGTPQTPPPAGATGAAAGTGALSQGAGAAQGRFLTAVYFEPDTAVLLEYSRSTLNAVGWQLMMNPDLRLLLRGYAAPFKTEAGRRIVSQERVDFCRDYLARNYGITANRIRSEAYGSDRTPENVTDDWETYRCVELFIIFD